MNKFVLKFNGLRLSLFRKAMNLSVLVWNALYRQVASAEKSVDVLEFKIRQAEYKAKTVVKVDARALFEALYNKAYPSETLGDGNPHHENDSPGDLMPDVGANTEGQQPDGPAPKKEDKTDEGK